MPYFFKLAVNFYKACKVSKKYVCHCLSQKRKVRVDGFNGQKREIEVRNEFDFELILRPNSAAGRYCIHFAIFTSHSCMEK